MDTPDPYAPILFRFDPLPAEEALLGACLKYPLAARLTFRRLYRHGFCDPRNALIVEAIDHCLSMRRPVTLAAVKAILETGDNLLKAGGLQYLRQLLDAAAREEDILVQVRIINSIAVSRKFREAIVALGCTNSDEATDLAEIAARALRCYWASEQFGDGAPTRAGDRAPACGGEGAPTRSLANLNAGGAHTSWTWPGWLPSGHLTILFAPPDAGKSYLALELSRALTAPARWPDGHRGANNPGHILWLDYEGAEVITMERARAAGLPLGRILLCPQGDPPSLYDCDSQREITAWLTASKASLLVVDSWREATQGLRESDSRAVAACATRLRCIAQQTNCPVLLLHHSRKPPSGDTWTLSMSDLRGTGALAASARVILGIEKPDPGSNVRRLRAVKNNLGPRPAPLGFTIDSRGLHWTNPPVAPNPEPAAREAPALEAARVAILATLSGDPVCYRELSRRLLAAGIKPATMQRALETLRIQGLLIRPSWGSWQVKPGTCPPAP